MAPVTVRVLTDSAATLPPDLADRLGVVVVPAWLTVGERRVRDGDLGLEEILSLVEAGERITSAGPAPGDFLAAIGRSAGAEGAIVVTVARRLGASTFESARAAAGLAPGPVRVVDSATAAGGQGLIATAAAALAATGAGLDEVETRALEVRRRVRVVAALSRLDYLVKGGHVPSVAAWAGRVVGLRPLVELTDGSVRPLRPALSDEAAVARMREALRSSRPPGGVLHVAVLDALSGERSARLEAEVVAEWRPAEVFSGSFSTVMVVHSGPELLGLGWWWEVDQPAG
jgi:DegV family protein with EDD domain